MNSKSVSSVRAIPAPKATIYKRSFDLPDNHDDMDGRTIEIAVGVTRSNFRFTFYAEQDPHCCGIYSLGNFNISGNSTVIPDTEKVAAIKQGFAKLIDRVKSGTTELTLMLTTIDNNPCNLVSKALADGSIFTRVKRFKNINSNTINDLYISN